MLLYWRLPSLLLLDQLPLLLLDQLLLLPLPDELLPLLDALDPLLPSEDQEPADDGELEEPGEAAKAAADMVQSWKPLATSSTQLLLQCQGSHVWAH